MASSVPGQFSSGTNQVSVTQQTLEIIATCCTSLKHFRVASIPLHPKFGINYVVQMKELETLSLAHWTRLIDENLQGISEIPHLHSLDVSSSLYFLTYNKLTNCRRITDKGIQNLVAKSPQKFRLLILNGIIKLTNESLRLLGHCSNLTGIHLDSMKAIDIDGIKSIADGCTKLRTLAIAWADGITDEVYGTTPPSNLVVQSLEYFFTHSTKLEAVSLLYLKQVTVRGVAAVNNLHNLRRLQCELRSVSIPSEIFEGFSKNLHGLEVCLSDLV